MTMHWMLNGRWIPPEPRELPSMIIEQIPDLRYWSRESLDGLHLGLLQLTMEMAKAIKADEKKRGLTAIIRKTERKIKIIERVAKTPSTQISALQRIYDLLLSYEGLSLLHGFGLMSQVRNGRWNNPERQSIYNINKEG